MQDRAAFSECCQEAGNIFVQESDHPERLKVVLQRCSAMESKASAAGRDSLSDLWLAYYWKTNQSDRYKRALESMRASSSPQSQAWAHYLLAEITEDERIKRQHYQAGLQCICPGAIDLSAPQGAECLDPVLALELLQAELETEPKEQSAEERYRRALAAMALVEYCAERGLWSPERAPLWNLGHRHSAAFDEVSSWRFLIGYRSVYEQAFRLALRRHSETGDRVFVNDAFLIAERYDRITLRSAWHWHRFWGISKEALLWEQTTERDCRRARIQAAESPTDSQALQRLEALMQRSVQQRLQWKARHSDYAAWSDPSRVTDLPTLQKTLPDSTAFLRYTDLLDEDSLAAFVIDRNQVHLFKTARIREQDLDTNRLKALHRLYSGYFPAERIDGSVRRLLVCEPSSAWHSRLPMELWLPQTPAEGAADYRRLPYLLRRYAFGYQSSATDWLEQLAANERVSNHQLLGLGAVEMQDKSADSAAVSAQLRRLSELYKGYFPAGASLNDWTVYSGDYGILHLAAPLYPKSGEDLEILWSDGEKWGSMDLRVGMLRAALVVMDGHFDRQERSFDWRNTAFVWAQSGAAALLLPRMEQKSGLSLRLVEHFYALLAEGLPKDQALRQAKLTHLELAPEFAIDPELWAGYTLWGDVEPCAPAQPLSGIWWYLLPILFVLFIGRWTLGGLRQRRRF